MSSNNRMSFAYRNVIIDIYDNIGRTVMYKGRRGRIQGIAIGNDDQICYVVERDEPDSDKWKTALFPIDQSSFYDTQKILDATFFNYNDCEYHSYFGCFNAENCTHDCPAQICGQTPKAFYGVSTCREAMALDKLYRARDDIKLMFNQMGSKESKYNH